MFGLFAWIMRKAVSPMVGWLPDDSSIYIVRFRKPLLDTAKALSEHGYPSVDILFRVAKKDRWVDLYNKKGLVAQVRVHGEMGRPDEVIVACNLSIEAEAVFAKFFPDLRVTFKALTL